MAGDRRRTLSLVAGALAAAVLLAEPAVAGRALEQPFDLGLVARAVLRFVFTIVICLLTNAIAPGFTERTIAAVRDDPVENFLYGLLASILALVALVLLVLSILGLLVLFPALLGLLAIGLMGTAVGTMAVGSVLARDVEPTVAAVVGSVVMALVSLVPIVGAIAGFVVSTIGFGAVVVHLRRGE